MKIVYTIGGIVGAMYFCGNASAYPAPYSCTRNFYVATTGTDATGCGTSQANACATIQGANNNIALQAGDCVNVGAGTYNTATTINLTKGGSANQANGYVTYIGAPNHGAVINYTAAFDPGLMINIPYVIIDGFDFNGNGITTDKLITNIGVFHMYDTNYRGTSHHLMVLNNFLHDTQGAGVAFTMGDYYIYAGNTVWNTCTVNNWGESGLYFFEAMNLPGFTPTLPWDTQYYHYQVLDNIVHDNAVSQSGSHSDGNGIDFDDFQYIQWRNYGNPATVPSAYTGHGLIAGNVVYHNGGAGILIAPSSGYADLYNNTVYNNGADPSGDHTEIGLSATNTNVVNNILLPPSGHTAFSVGTAWGLSDTGNTFTYNMTWDGNSADNGVSVSGTTNDSGYYAQFTGSSAHNQLGVNPNLVNPPTDFHPLSGSPVLNAGAAFPAGILPGPASTTPDSYTFPSPPNIGAYNSAAAINTVAGPVSISAGGPAASPFVADAGFNGGTAANGYTGTIDTSLVANPAPQSVYQNQRYGPSFLYVVSSLTPGKTYQVILHFTEDWNTAVGQRQENISINGTQVLSAFDIFATAGAQHKAIAQSFSTAADANGKITISFAGTAGLADPNAKVDGIQVITSSDWLLSANSPIQYCSSVTLGHLCAQAVQSPNRTYWQPSSIAADPIISVNLQALYKITKITGLFDAPCLPNKVNVFTSTGIGKGWKLVYTDTSPSLAGFSVSFPNAQNINVQEGQFVEIITAGFGSGCFKMQTLQVYGH
jgi:parallel beta-helix repeat protein